METPSWANKRATEPSIQEKSLHPTTPVPSEDQDDGHQSSTPANKPLTGDSLPPEVGELPKHISATSDQNVKTSHEIGVPLNSTLEEPHTTVPSDPLPKKDEGDPEKLAVPQQGDDVKESEGPGKDQGKKGKGPKQESPLNLKATYSQIRQYLRQRGKTEAENEAQTGQPLPDGETPTGAEPPATGEPTATEEPLISAPSPRRPRIPAVLRRKPQTGNEAPTGHPPPAGETSTTGEPPLTEDPATTEDPQATQRRPKIPAILRRGRGQAKPPGEVPKDADTVRASFWLLR